MDLPYRAEYAKSSRASCRGCKSAIGKDTLRLAVMVQSPMFDGKTPQWYHHMCFFTKQRPKTVDDIEHFESLRYDDQKLIKDKLASLSVILKPNAKGQKRDSNVLAAKKQALKDFKIEYSKSSRALCRGCEQKILKDEIRISKKDFETDVGKKYGGQDMWHHLTCFAKLRAELCYFESADKLPGYNTLKKDDKKSAVEQLPAIKQEEVSSKKMKTEDAVDSSSSSWEDDIIYKRQNKLMFKYRDQLKNNLNKNELTELLAFNRQEVPVGIEEILDRLSDVITFGALKPCKVCSGGQYIFQKIGYVCHGNLTEWTKCNTVTKSPERRPFKIPADLAKEHIFLKTYKYVPATRFIRDVKSSVDVKKEDEVDGKPKVERERPPLYNMDFVIIGKPKRGKDELKKQIVKLGGKVVTKITVTTMAVIASKEDVEKMGARITEAKDKQVHIVPEEFIDACVGKKTAQIVALILKQTICDWGADPAKRLPVEPSTSTSSKSKSRSIYTSSMPSKVKLKLKSGGAVDPDSGVDDIAHIYQNGSIKYNAVLGLTDIQRQKNSYYKLQLLEADDSNKYWLFRSWGRIGTTIGGNKLEIMCTLTEAIRSFCDLYMEKSGNDWDDKDNFVKVPGRMHPIDVAYDDEVDMNIIDNSKSTLAEPVQDLMKLIFDINLMKTLMLEFELDTEKMPLGKLSKKQIQNAYSVLTELQILINQEAPEARFIDASNRFYTFIPHSFGISDPPILNNSDIIKQKIEMLDNLLDLEIAYNLMSSSGSEHTADGYYKKLNAEIDVLDQTKEEFEIIREYVKNTHAKTHSNYELVIEDVFTIKRNGEAKKFKPFRKLSNRKLLWHGSRVTNYAGILSQGLRIAPPEAPVTGYMFGKGIYFADMVSKSANYCCTNSTNSKGLVLLCEVALGEMYERTNAEYVEKLPKGKHSTLGLGRTVPDASGVKYINGVEVPAGKGVPSKHKESSLLYNEYIVYDTAQVNIQYLVKMDFKYKY